MKSPPIPKVHGRKDQVVYTDPKILGKYLDSRILSRLGSYDLHIIFSRSSWLMLIALLYLLPILYPSAFVPSFFARFGSLLVIIVTLFVAHHVEESELVHAWGGADHAEPVAELLLFEVFLGSVAWY